VFENICKLIVWHARFQLHPCVCFLPFQFVHAGVLVLVAVYWSSAECLFQCQKLAGKASGKNVEANNLVVECYHKAKPIGLHALRLEPGNSPHAAADFRYRKHPRMGKWVLYKGQWVHVYAVSESGCLEA
jgi:hypothetical protein